MTVTVEFAVEEPGSCPVATASDRANEPVSSVSRASLTTGEGVTEEFELAAEGAMDDRDDVRSVGSTDAGTVYRFEREPGRSCVCESIEQIAGPATDVRAEGGALVVTARAESLETVRSVVDRLREQFDGVSVRRLVDLDAQDSGKGSGDGNDGLTGRQREVLETAYDMGYFEYPKGANAGEVAAELGISRSTLTEHLAAAQVKVFDSALSTDRSVTPSKTRS